MNQSSLGSVQKPSNYIKSNVTIVLNHWEPMWCWWWWGLPRKRIKYPCTEREREREVLRYRHLQHNKGPRNLVYTGLHGVRGSPRWSTPAKLNYKINSGRIHPMLRGNWALAKQQGAVTLACGTQSAASDRTRARIELVSIDGFNQKLKINRKPNSGNVKWPGSRRSRPDFARWGTHESVPMKMILVRSFYLV